MKSSFNVVKANWKLDYGQIKVKCVITVTSLSSNKG